MLSYVITTSRGVRVP